MPIDTPGLDIIEIIDADDVRLAPFRGLRDRSFQHIARGTAIEAQLAGRPTDQLIVAEGMFIVQTLVQTGRQIVVVLVERARYDDMVRTLDQQTPCDQSCVVYVADRAVLSSIVGYPFHRGVIAIAQRAEPIEPMELARRSRALVVLEDLANHENVGTIFRTVAALGGLDVGIIVSAGCTDPMYRRSVRVSMGHVLRQPYAVAADLPDVLSSLRASGYVIAALAPASSAPAGVDHIQIGAICQFLDEKKTALVFGSEGHGLTERTMRACDVACSIPIAPGVDSLNVNVAVGVVLASIGLNHVVSG